MDVSIMQACSVDAAKILTLQKAAYQSEARLYDDWGIPPLTQTLAEIEAEFETKVFLKAVYLDKIIGSVRASLEAGTCLVGRLIVRPEYQGKGIGTLLMRRIEAVFCEAERFELFTGTKSEGNIRLYQQLGYRECCKKELSETIQLVFMDKNGTRN